jgi:hypothetical protein
VKSHVVLVGGLAKVLAGLGTIVGIAVGVARLLGVA